MIVHELLEAPRIRHGFFTREGGVSEGLFASLNCGFGSGDDAARVSVNRARVAENLGVAADRLVTCYQIHSADAVVVETPWRREAPPRADGMVTTVPGQALGFAQRDADLIATATAIRDTVGSK